MFDKKALGTRQPRSNWYPLLSLALFCMGILSYGIYNEIIIIRLPFKKAQPIAQSTAQRKNTKLFYWNGTSFEHEEKELLHSTNIVKSLSDLIAAWLTTQEEEHQAAKKVTLQSVMIDSSGREAYISFDRNPLPNNKATYQKLLWIEGLLKTIKESGLPVSSVRFLVYGKPLIDTHLDFNHPWPISGYSKNV